MALARFLASRVNFATSLRSLLANTSNYQPTRVGLINGLLGPSAILGRFSTSSSSESGSAAASQSGQVVSGETSSSIGGGRRRSRWTSLLPRRLQPRRNQPRDDSPSFFELFSPSLGNVLLEATCNVNWLLDNLSPSQLIGRMKEKDDSYKLQFEVPGLTKEDVRITVNDGVLNIRGEHKEEEEHRDNETLSSSSSEEDEEEFGGFFSNKRSYGYYYNTSLVLPDDVKEEGIKAELKDGVLTVVPKDQKKRAKDVKEIKIF